MPITLSLLPEAFSVLRFHSETPVSAISSFIDSSMLYSITKTPEELSLLLPTRSIPSASQLEYKQQGGFKCFKVHGPLDFALVGIISKLTRILAQHGISVFVVSTYDTDYVLVNETNVDKTIARWREQGHDVIIEGHGV